MDRWVICQPAMMPRRDMPAAGSDLRKAKFDR